MIRDPIDQVVTYCQTNQFDLNFQFQELPPRNNPAWQCDIQINRCTIASASSSSKKHAKRTAAERVVMLLPLKEIPFFEDDEKPNSASNVFKLKETEKIKEPSEPVKEPVEKTDETAKSTDNAPVSSGVAYDEVVVALLNHLLLNHAFLKEKQSLESDEVTVSLYVEGRQVAIGYGPNEHEARLKTAKSVLLTDIRDGSFRLIPDVYFHTGRQNPVAKLEFKMLMKGWSFEFQDVAPFGDRSKTCFVELLVNGEQYERLAGDSRNEVCAKLARRFLNQTGSARSIMQQNATKEGREMEWVVVDTMQTFLRVGTLPEWFQGIEQATPEQDRQGIDVVVLSDVGPLFIQLKRSERGKRKFLKRRRSTRIEVVIIDSRDETMIRNRILAAAEILRNEIKSKRYQPSYFPPEK